MVIKRELDVIMNSEVIDKRVKEIILFLVCEFEKLEYNVGIKGSLAFGNWDEYSDIDLVVNKSGIKNYFNCHDELLKVISSKYEILSHSIADHINMSNILIITIKDTQFGIIKIDLEYLQYDRYMSVKDNKFKELVNSEVHRIVIDINSKIINWLWYTYTKILRGEYLEAYNSLNCIRIDVVVKFIHILENTPFEGYRRIEERIDEELLNEILLTIPTQPSKTELLSSLKKTMILYQKQLKVYESRYSKQLHYRLDFFYGIFNL